MKTKISKLHYRATLKQLIHSDDAILITDISTICLYILEEDMNLVIFSQKCHKFVYRCSLPSNRCHLDIYIKILKLLSPVNTDICIAHTHTHTHTHTYTKTNRYSIKLSNFLKDYFTYTDPLIS